MEIFLFFGIGLSVMVAVLHIALENPMAAMVHALFAFTFAHILHAIILKDDR